MNVLNLRFCNIKATEINRIIEEKLEPKYSTEFDDLINYFFEQSPLYSSSGAMVTLSTQQRDENTVVSIVAGGEPHSRRGSDSAHQRIQENLLIELEKRGLSSRSEVINSFII